MDNPTLIGLRAAASLSRLILFSRNMRHIYVYVNLK